MACLVSLLSIWVYDNLLKHLFAVTNIYYIYDSCDGYGLRGYTAMVLPPGGVICHTLYKELS